MSLIYLKFIACAALIFFSGRRVARYGDIIAEKTNLGGVWIGTILLAITTSLPEIFTGVGSTVFVDAPDLTLGNLFGANTYNLLNLALLDLLNRGGPLLSGLSPGQLLTAGLSLLPLTIASAGIFLSPRLPPLAFANVSLFSILILFSYLFSARTIFKFEQGRKDARKDEVAFKYTDISLKRASIFYGVFAVVIVGAGIWLSYLGRDLSATLGLGQNFVGSLFIGFITTLPEITVSVAALRLGAKEMAVANMLGSNLFNMTIIFLNDLFYRKAGIFQVASQNHILTSLMIIFMTAVVISAIILKPQRKTLLNLSWYALWLVVIFVAGHYANFILAR